MTDTIDVFEEPSDLDGLTMNVYEHRSRDGQTLARPMAEPFAVRKRGSVTQGDPGDYLVEGYEGAPTLYEREVFENLWEAVDVYVTVDLDENGGGDEDDEPAVFDEHDDPGGFEECRKTATAEARRMDQPFVVETPEGTMRGESGDYLMRGADGELYPCDAEIFDETYAWGAGRDNEDDHDSRPDTVEHIRRVRTLLLRVGRALLERADDHDRTKLEAPEKAIYDEYTPKLADCEYGSEEYERYLEEMNEALGHHYAEYRHHPEHFEGGIGEMHLLDLLEMLVDWYAAVERHDDGADIFDSIAENAERFGYGDELRGALENTAEWIGGLDG